MKPFTVDLHRLFYSLNLSDSSLPSSEIFIKGVTTDTRTLQAGDWFVAINGERVNGINFLEEAVFNGANGAIVCEADFKRIADKKNYPIPIIKVPKVIEAYGALSKAYLNHITQGHAHHRIAITGSAGKTSCKDFLSHLLSFQFKVFTSQKNFNNALGVPQNIFTIDEPFDFYIFELGMNHSGEIDYLSSLIEPHVSVITNVLPSHIGFFDSTLR